MTFANDALCGETAVTEVDWGASQEDPDDPEHWRHRNGMASNSANCRITAFGSRSRSWKLVSWK